jgi:hypothetical protein
MEKHDENKTLMIKCVVDDPGFLYLTFNKTYEVLYEVKSFYQIVDDSGGDQHIYDKSLFVKLFRGKTSVNGFKNCMQLMFNSPMCPLVAKENRFKFRYNDMSDRIEFFGDENQVDWLEDENLYTTSYWFTDNYEWNIRHPKYTQGRHIF